MAISYDAPAILSAFARQRRITFPLLSDADSRTIRAYGLLNPAVEWGLGPNRDDPAVREQVRRLVNAAGTASENQRGMAIPGTLIVDARGRVTARFFEAFYAERPTTETIMLRAGPGAEARQGTRISTPHLDATAYASDQVVAPGNRFTLVVEVTPRSGMHVYAPGARGYKPIELRIERAAFTRSHPLEYPPSEIYFFEPLNERVPVFQRPFRLLQDVTLEATREAMAALQNMRTLTLTATLDYQACDDKVCYNPMSIPLTWTVSLQPLVRERPVPGP